MTAQTLILPKMMGCSLEGHASVDIYMNGCIIISASTNVLRTGTVDDIDWLDDISVISKLIDSCYLMHT